MTSGAVPAGGTTPVSAGVGAALLPDARRQAPAAGRGGSGSGRDFAGYLARKIAAALVSFVMLLVARVHHLQPDAV